jgi:hypothetical protein
MRKPVCESILQPDVDALCRLARGPRELLNTIRKDSPQIAIAAPQIASEFAQVSIHRNSEYGLLAQKCQKDVTLARHYSHPVVKLARQFLPPSIVKPR